MQLLNVIMPGNISIVYDIIYMIATFDLIPMDMVDEHAEKLLSGLDNSDQHARHETESTQDSFDSTNPFLNLSLEISIMLAMITLHLATLGLAAIVSPHSRQKEQKLKAMVDVHYPSCYFRFSLEEYLTISIVVLIKLYALDFSNWFEVLSSVFAMLLGIAVILAPFWIWYFLYKHHKQIKE